MEIIISPWEEARYNSALENLILTARQSDVLLLYINRPSVIVGRHQTIEAEVDTAYCREHGIEIVRRMSGGGTVYHDYGNINYAFMVNKPEGFVLDHGLLEPIRSALHNLGIDTEIGPRHDLWLDGKKISGTASTVKRDRMLFHGTLLYDADLERLQFALKGNAALRGKGVASVPSPVVNIKSAMRVDLSTAEFLSSFAEELLEYYRREGFSHLSTEDIRVVEESVTSEHK